MFQGMDFMSQRSRTAVVAQDREDQPRPTPRRSGLLRFGALVLVLLLLLAALAPTIISFTSLGPYLVASAAKGRIDGSLDVKSVSIGWLSPVQVSGMTVKDKDDQTIATIESVVVGKSLLALIGNSQDLGTITIDKPQLLVVARPGGSNVEDLLAPLLSQ